MCGISFILDRTPSPDTLELLERMHAPIRHRGPDGEGLLLVSPAGAVTRLRHFGSIPDSRQTSIGVAFRRLKIRDCSEASAQPMSSADGSCWVVFNGEIYNFRELRAELELRGRRFETTGDTEVVIAAYEAWGEQCFERLDGMWAIVIVDLARRRLIGSRDRLGIKPLYWYRDGNRLLLVSEIKQILAATSGRPAAHAPLVRMFLSGVRWPCLDETFFRSVRSVPPATWFDVPFDGEMPPEPVFREYWHLSDFSANSWNGERYADALGRFRGLLSNAVDSHRIADVQVGSLLSGGLDSSTLTALSAPLMKSDRREFPTFSFGFGEAAPRYCELSYVDKVVARTGVRNHRTTFDSRWLIENEAKVIAALEEPPLALPAFAQYRTFQFCREHDTTVVLDGEGSDEVLAGYPYHQRSFLWEQLRGGKVGRFARETRAIAQRQHTNSWTLLCDFFLVPALRRAKRRAEPWLSAEYGIRRDEREFSHALSDRGQDHSVMNQRLYRDVRWGNVKHVLSYTDKTSMAHSVEARVPYLDRTLVEFAFSLPAEYKVGRGDRKRILRDVARTLLPPEITERRDRMGFATPDRQILEQAMNVRLYDTLLDREFLSWPCFEPAALRRFVEDFRSGRHGEFRTVWRLYALALWQRTFGVSVS